MFARFLSIDPVVEAFSSDELHRIRDDLCGSTLPTVGPALTALYEQVSHDNFANRMHLLPRPANWVCWASEKICHRTANHDLNLMLPAGSENVQDATGLASTGAGAATRESGGHAATSGSPPRAGLVANISPPAAPFIRQAVLGEICPHAVIAIIHFYSL